MLGIYLGAYRALHDKYDIVYQDINGQRDMDGDMMNVDLTPYDFIIATPPCNYYSRANWRRETSVYSQKTKHLLPGILKKLVSLGKPFIVENVRSSKKFQEIGLFDLPCKHFIVGRHTYWTNVDFQYDDIIQKPKVEIINGKVLYWSSQNLGSKDRQGTEEVHEVIERFLQVCHVENL